MSLFTELKRRNVFRVAAAYVVGAWLLLQVADLVLENIGAPDWVIQSLMLLLGLGFVAAVAVSWVYELTPDGIRKESEIDPSESIVQHTAKKLDILTLVAVAALIGLLAYQQFHRGDTGVPPADSGAGTEALASDEGADTVQPATASDSVASVAVLPFADLSPAGDQGYFCDGVSEEILNALTRVEGLKVASRTSSFQFRQNDAVSIPEIARALQVRHVLEGSVRKAGDTIRVTAQLIDSQIDGHVWSETFDRTLSAENVFAIQDEIAGAIVARLKAEANSDATATGTADLVSADTGNLDAYEAFLKGQQLFVERSQSNIPAAIAALEQAVAADPDFARAWSQLAAVYGVAESWGVIDRDYPALAQQAAQRAIALNPAQSLPFAVLAWVLGESMPVDFAELFAKYGEALERDPNDTTALLWRGIAYINIGYFAQSIADFEHCLAIDPAYENCRRYLAAGRLLAGDTETAVRLFEQGIEMGSTSNIGYFALAYTALGDERATLLALALSQTAFGRDTRIRVLYQAITDPDFDFDLGARMLDWDPSGEVANDNFVNFILRRYDNMTANVNSFLHWLPMADHMRRTPHFKRLLREHGVDQYWRLAGFPPQCRAVGDQDFECD